MFQLITYFSTIEIYYIHGIERRRLLSAEKGKKLIGHCACLQENDDLPH